MDVLIAATAMAGGHGLVSETRLTSPTSPI